MIDTKEVLVRGDTVALLVGPPPLPIFSASLRTENGKQT